LDMCCGMQHIYIYTYVCVYVCSLGVCSLLLLYQTKETTENKYVDTTSYLGGLMEKNRIFYCLKSRSIASVPPQILLKFVCRRCASSIHRFPLRVLRMTPLCYVFISYFHLRWICFHFLSLLTLSRFFFLCGGRGNCCSSHFCVVNSCLLWRASLVYPISSGRTHSSLCGDIYKTEELLSSFFFLDIHILLLFRRCSRRCCCYL